MTRRLHRSLAVSMCATACAAVAAVCLSSTLSVLAPVNRVVRADQNGDGWPDGWQTYDRQGQLAEVDVDTNFDGRSDVQEYYESGALVRREADRDFNDRVDLIQDFDPTTSEPTRSVVDVDFDGRADLLVLFRAGQPVFSKWTHQAEPVIVAGFTSLKAHTSHRTANDPLAPLQDPFSAEASMRAVHVLVGTGGSVGLSTSGGLPASPRDGPGPLVSLSAITSRSVSSPTSIIVAPYSPRGPPASRLLS